MPDEAVCPGRTWTVGSGNREHPTFEAAKQYAVEQGLDPELANYTTQWCADTATLVRCLCQETGAMRGQTCPVHDLGLQPGPAEGLGAAQVAQLEASIREAERDVLRDENAKLRAACAKYIDDTDHCHLCDSRPGCVGTHQHKPGCILEAR